MPEYSQTFPHRQVDTHTHTPKPDHRIYTDQPGSLFVRGSKDAIKRPPTHSTELQPETHYSAASRRAAAC